MGLQGQGPNLGPRLGPRLGWRRLGRSMHEELCCQATAHQFAAPWCLQALLDIEQPLGPAALKAEAGAIRDLRAQYLDGFDKACSTALTLCLEPQLLRLTAEQPQLVAALQRTMLETLGCLSRTAHSLSGPQLHNLYRLASKVCSAFGNEQLGSFAAVGAEQSVLDQLQACQLTCHCLAHFMRGIQPQTASHWLDTATAAANATAAATATTTASWSNSQVDQLHCDGLW